ncbi:MAG TPA: radical SAM protein [Spirochaetota bacterium]|nr:radical SAM protein [Spirochaetota bacterium]HOS38377.1 radical SAM protein [Spirochaetota bacterium]HPI22566.1 radical SAM protein [Spirochaetota bacterium]HPU90082.1 radical SAM protein [Spirochaetota bacterium]
MNLRAAIGEHPGLIARLGNLPVDPLADTPVLFAKIKLLWQCNLSCVFCRRPRARAPMPAERALSLLTSLRARGLRKVHFSGGEVFLHPEIISILSSSAALGLQVNLTTNGTLIGREEARAIVDAGAHSVSVSLDSHDPKRHDELRGHKGAFKKTSKAIELLLRYRKKDPVLRVNTVVTRKNFPDLEAMRAFIDSLGGRVEWKLIPVDSSNRSLLLDTAQARALIDVAGVWTKHEAPSARAAAPTPRDITRGRYSGGYYGEHPCYMPWLHLFVDPAGFAYPCCMTRGKTPALGNLADAPLDDLLGGERMKRVRMSMAAGNAFAVCRNCDDFIEENALIESEINSLKGGIQHEHTRR